MIHCRPDTFSIRIYEDGFADPYKTKEKYKGILKVTALTDDIAMISNFVSDSLKKKDFKDIRDNLRSLGFSELVMERHGKLIIRTLKENPNGTQDKTGPTFSR